MVVVTGRQELDKPWIYVSSTARKERPVIAALQLLSKKILLCKPLIKKKKKIKIKMDTLSAVRVGEIISTGW